LKVHQCLFLDRLAAATAFLVSTIISSSLLENCLSGGAAISRERGLWLYSYSPQAVGRRQSMIVSSQKFTLGAAT
jgi:hypothetical protein